MRRYFIGGGVGLAFAVLVWGTTYLAFQRPAASADRIATYERCSEQREMRYEKAENDWFDALKVAQDESGEKQRKTRHDAYAARTKALAVERKEKC